MTVRLRFGTTTVRPRSVVIRPSDRGGAEGSRNCRANSRTVTLRPAPPRNGLSLGFRRRLFLRARALEAGLLPGRAEAFRLAALPGRRPRPASGLIARGTAVPIRGLSPCGRLPRGIAIRAGGWGGRLGLGGATFRFCFLTSGNRWRYQQRR